ncbi:MAG: hypothetical protein Q9169_002261 [Polycauliona sp. 2 TL-2023]
MQGSPQSVRKSGRARQPNRKYANDIITLDPLDSASEHEVELPTVHQLDRSSDSDEFDEGQALEEINKDDGQEDVVSSTGSDTSARLTPDQPSDCIASDADVDVDVDAPQVAQDGPRNPKRNRPYVMRQRRQRSDGMHVRGITDPAQTPAKGFKNDYLYSLFGDATQDLLHMARSRDQWYHEATLPRRMTEAGTQGMRHFFSHPEEQRQLEAGRGWDWYYDHGGQQYLSDSQATFWLGADEGLAHLAHSPTSSRTIHMGPYGRQLPFDLTVLQTLSLSRAWEQASLQNVAEDNESIRSTRHKRQDETFDV